MLLMSASLATMVMSILKILVIQTPPTRTEDVEYNMSLGILWAGMEQTVVIIMGCVPTLRSIAKLDLPRLTAIGSSLSSLVKRNKSKPSSLEDDVTRPSAKEYQDLEMNTNELGNLGQDRDAQGFTATSTYFIDDTKGSNQSLVEDKQAAGRIKLPFLTIHARTSCLRQWWRRCDVHLFTSVELKKPDLVENDTR